MIVLRQGLNLINPLVDRAQSDRAPQRGTPALGDLTQTLARADTPQDILIQIQPKPVVFLQNRILTDHIVLAFLTLEHRYPQVLDLPPARLQLSAVMAIAREIIGITTSAVFTLPINFSRLFIYLTSKPFLSS